MRSQRPPEQATTEVLPHDVDRVIKPLYGGDFATSNGLPLGGVLPGEVVASRDPLRIEQLSRDRVEPKCIHFGTCGGCQYQHAFSAEQLRIKQAVLAEILGAAGLGNLPELQTHSAEPFGYRNRIRLRVQAAGDGSSQKIEFGYSLRQTNVFLPITMCPIASPLLWRAALQIQELATTSSLIYGWMQAASALEVFCDGTESTLQLQFLMRAAPPSRSGEGHFDRVCESLKAAIPELAGAGAIPDPELSRRTRKLLPEASWGQSGLSYSAAGQSYWVPRGAFFQVNRFLVEKLASIVTEGMQGDLCWDLYAGVGLFARVLAGTFSDVIAVEGAVAAVSSLRSAARQQPSLKPVCSATLDFLKGQKLQRARPSLVVLDPPRAGIGEEAAAILLGIAPQRIHYVSCDPVTLARDLSVLTRRYRIEEIHLIDLFPQTFHLETITKLILR